MGLSDKVLDKKEAFGAIAMAAVASDGEVSPEDVQRVAIDLMTLKAFRKADLVDLANILNKVAGLIKKRIIGPVLQAAKVSLSKDELGTAFLWLLTWFWPMASWRRTMPPLPRSPKW